MPEATLADICIAACAEAWRGDGEILASPIGTIPSLGVRLAVRTFEPDLVFTDGEAYLLAAAVPLTATESDKVVEGWMPFRNVFDVVWSGKRHVMMGATQVDRFGNQNIANIGPWAKPKSQLLGVRGAPGNTINHPTSYWVPAHTTRAFVEQVDTVSGVGYDRAAAAGPTASRYHEIRYVISNKAVLDFQTDDHRMRLRSVHPGVSVDDVVANTGFELVIPGDVPETRVPGADELAIIDELDPKGARHREVQP
jgi:acyl CoA:acetate/3-ketoacid CoA transferase beta subunit